VFRSWKEESFKDYGEYHIEEFDSVWEGNENGTITFDIPSRYYDDVKNYWSSEGPPSSELEKEAAKKIAEMFDGNEIDIVLGPALGGIIIGYETARALGKKSLFSIN
jgi:hypothetical protein